MIGQPWEQRSYFLTLAYWYGVPEAHREDAAQEMALKVWRAGSPAWRVVAKRALVDFMRTFGRRNRQRWGIWWQVPDGVPDVMEDRGANPEVTDALIDLADALEGLPERDREFVLRVAIGEESRAALAADVGLCPTRVGQIVLRAQRQLRKACAC